MSAPGLLLDIYMLTRHRPLSPPTSSIFWFECTCIDTVPNKIIESSRTNFLLNPSCVRFLTRPTGEHVTPILSSLRYSRYCENISRLVAQPDFTGYWVLRYSLKSPDAPSNSDLTVFYLHGGGYFPPQPPHYLLLLRRLVESIIEQGVSVSISH